MINEKGILSPIAWDTDRELSSPTGDAQCLKYRYARNKQRDGVLGFQCQIVPFPNEARAAEAYHGSIAE